MTSNCNKASFCEVYPLLTFFIIRVGFQVFFIPVIFSKFLVSESNAQQSEHITIFVLSVILFIKLYFSLFLTENVKIVFENLLSSGWFSNGNILLPIHNTVLQQMFGYTFPLIHLPITSLTIPFLTLPPSPSPLYS